MKLTLAEADAVPVAVQLPGPEVLRKPGTELAAVVDPKKFPYGVLERADVFVLHMIADSRDRPVYLSATDGDYGRRLGLENYLVTQGLARKVLDSPLVATRDTLNLAGAGWIDVTRSLELWHGFAAPRSLLRRTDWIDRPSIQIPALYAIQGLTLSNALARTGDTADARSVLSTVSGIVRSTKLEDLFGAPEPSKQGS